MNHEHRQQHRKEEEQIPAHLASASTHGRETKEFSNPEELIRYDAARTEVPAHIAQRLQDTIAKTGEARLPWWKRWWPRS